jgi:molybdopterin synthase catalytic subunit
VIEAQEQDTIKVRVLFFGAARDLTGHAEVDLSLHGPADAASAFEQVLAAFPDLRRFGRSLLFAVNQEYAPVHCVVREGDELAVFPPVSGGGPGDAETRGQAATVNSEDANTGTAGVSPAVRTTGASGWANQETIQPTRNALDFFELTTDRIDVGAVARRVVPPACGATVTLDGYAREWTRGRQTQYLVYEAYAPMAQIEMQRLGREAHEQFDIAHVGIVHRTGRLEIGETSVVISVSAPHRGAAFKACEWAIRELKRTVPIWKKEVFADGEEWVEGETQLRNAGKVAG